MVSILLDSLLSDLDWQLLSRSGGLPLDATAAEIHAYEAPWKALCDFALHSDLGDKMSMANSAHYGQLVSQV